MLGQAVQGGSNVEDKGANGDSNGVVDSMEDIDNDRPTIKLLGSDMSIRRESNVRGSDSLGVSKGERVQYPGLPLHSR